VSRIIGFACRRWKLPPEDELATGRPAAPGYVMAEMRFASGETGGPPAAGLPRRSFGTTIPEDPAKSFARHAPINYTAEGVSCKALLPRDRS